MLYRMLCVPAWILFKILYRLEIRGREHIPPEGPVVLAANHTSYADAVVVALLSPRPVHFMAKEELWHIPLLGRLVQALHAFPVRRGHRDIESVKKAIGILKAGEVLGLFPEGARIRGETLGPGQPGVALVAIDGRAAIVPVGIQGTGRIMPDGSRIPRFPKVCVTAGQALSAEQYTTRRPDLHRLTGEIMSRIAGLADRELGSEVGSQGS